MKNDSNKLEHALFEKLPDWRQVEELNKNGIVLAQRQCNESTVTLLAIEGYFVERWTRNKVEVIGKFYRSANPLDIFDPYLPGLNVDRFLAR